MRRQGTSLPTQAREIYFSGDLRSRYNRHGIDVCVVPRVLNAADFAHGLFTFDVLKVMAIRIFKLLSDNTKFNPSFVCCCSEPSQQSYNTLKCHGPLLDLSEDLGQRHHQTNASSDPNYHLNCLNQKVITEVQHKLREKIANRDFGFNDKVHYALPGSRNAD